MLETIIGAAGGFIVGWAIMAGMTDGPKYPGDTNYGSNGGPGCFLSIVVVLVMTGVGAAIGNLYL